MSLVNYDNMTPAVLADCIEGLQNPTKPRNWQADGPLDIYIKHFMLDDFSQAIKASGKHPDWADADYQTLVRIMDNHPKDLREIYDIPRVTADEKKQLEPIKQHLLSIA